MGCRGAHRGRVGAGACFRWGRDEGVDGLNSLGGQAE